MTNKTFTRAGISTSNGFTRFRFTNDLNREQVLYRAGDTDIQFWELGEPMSKEQATQFLLSKGLTESKGKKPASQKLAAKKKIKPRYEDSFVEPKDEKIQVSMTRKARMYPGLSAQQLYEMVMLDFKAFPETGEPNF